MGQMVEIRAVIRREMLDRLIYCLKEAGVPRVTVAHVYAVGAGVDPASAKIAFEEGTEYADKALLQFTCVGEQCEMFTKLIARAARNGRRGDGIVSVTRFWAREKNGPAPSGWKRCSDSNSIAGNHVARPIHSVLRPIPESPENTSHKEES